MMKIGIVGGVAWQSTVLYYSELCRRGEQRHLARDPRGEPSTPEMIIESLNHAKAVSYIGSDGDEASWTRFDDYHRTALERLAASGAECALIASVSPHHRFEAIVRGIRIPVISIVDAVASASARIGARQVLLLGTAITMRSPRFREEFAKHGLAAAGPRDEAVRAMTVELITDLQLGKRAGAAERLLRIVGLSIEPGLEDPPVVCLACTELPLAFETEKALATFEHGGLSFINSSVVHIEAALDCADD
jgi:aspartate racemase